VRSSDKLGGSSLIPETVAIVSEKNQAAVTLGRLGGQKGGLARAKKLSKKARIEIARKAALARWGNKHGKKEGPQRQKRKPLLDVKLSCFANNNYGSWVEQYKHH